MSDIFWRHRYLLQVGDKVRVCADPDFPDRTRHAPVGKIGEIVGFSIDSICHTSSTIWRRPPGIYLNPEWPFVRFDGAVVQLIRADILQVLDMEEYNRRMERARLEYRYPGQMHGAFVSDLPDTKFWEGDIIRMEKRYNAPKPDPKKVKDDSIPGIPNAYMVCHLDYRDIAEGTAGITESLDNSPKFGIGDRFLRHWEGRFYDFQLELVERGNFWRRAHGEPLVFKDLEEESFFAWLCGKTESVPVPPRPLIANLFGYNDGYDREDLEKFSPAIQAESKAKWFDLDAALFWVRNGTAHGIQSHQVFEDLCDSKPYVYHNVLRFKNEELGQRVAKATLDGFRVPSKNWDEK